MLEGTGVMFAPDGARPELLEPAAPGEHVWVATAAYRLDAKATLAAHESGEQQHLDMENLAAFAIGCFVCEQPFSKRLFYRRCTGEPR
jgi:hypothetical protein